MHSLLFAFVLAVTITVVTPQCTPEQWEGKQKALTAYANAIEHGKVEEEMNVSYDATNNRSRVLLMRKDEGKWSWSSYLILTIFNGTVGHRYVKDLKTSECAVSVIKPPFPEVCIPVGAVFTGNFFLGLQGVYNVSSYFAMKGTLQSSLIVSHDGDKIVPVREVLTGVLYGYDTVQTFLFQNITPGIKSEHVFDVPKQCLEEAAWLARAEHLNRQHHVFAV